MVFKKEPIGAVPNGPNSDIKGKEKFSNTHSLPRCISLC